MFVPYSVHSCENVCIYCGDVCKRCNPLGNGIMMLQKILCRVRRECNSIYGSCLCACVRSFVFISVCSNFKQFVAKSTQTHARAHKHWVTLLKPHAIDRTIAIELTELVRAVVVVVVVLVAVAREHLIWSVMVDTIVYLDSWLKSSSCTNVCELYRIRSI